MRQRWARFRFRPKNLDKLQGTSIQYVQDYLPGGIEYRQNGTGLKYLEAVYHPEGRYYNTNVGNSNILAWRAEYNLRDHLGNTRLVFTDKTGTGTPGVIDVRSNTAANEILQENHYYAFGMAYEGNWLMNDAGVRDNAYQYNGKEINADFGLNWNDYGARWYDPAIGRWNAVDSEASQMPSISPFVYSFDNPVMYIDPQGNIPIIPWLLKAGAGAAADVLAQASMSYLFDPKVSSWSQAFNSVNWYQVGRSGLEGLIPWKTPGGRIGRAALTASGDVLVNALNNPSGYTAEQAGLDFSTGFIGDLAGGGFGDLIAKYGAKSVAGGLVGKLGWAAKSAHALTGVWHSITDGNFVGSLATKLGNAVEDIDVNFKFSGGEGDVDIITSGFNIEVKSGKSPNLSQSFKNSEYAQSQGKGYILYMPRANRAQVYDASKKGITILRTLDELKKAIEGN